MHAVKPSGFFGFVGRQRIVQHDCAGGPCPFDGLPIGIFSSDNVIDPLQGPVLELPQHLPTDSGSCPVILVLIVDHSAIRRSFEPDGKRQELRIVNVNQIRSDAPKLIFRDHLSSYTRSPPTPVRQRHEVHLVEIGPSRRPGEKPDIQARSGKRARFLEINPRIKRVMNSGEVCDA